MVVDRNSNVDFRTFAEQKKKPFILSFVENGGEYRFQTADHANPADCEDGSGSAIFLFAFH